MDGDSNKALRVEALALLTAALTLCDLLNEQAVACHVQLGLDLLTASHESHCLIHLSRDPLHQ